MNKTIKRTQEEVQAHYNKVKKELDEKNAQLKQLQEDVACIRAVENALYGALYLEDFNAETLSKGSNLDDVITSQRYYTSTCNWLVGNFHSAPFYKRLEEPQHSTIQTLEDFGKTDYTVFTID